MNFKMGRFGAKKSDTHQSQRDKKERQNGKEKDRYFWFLLVSSLLKKNKGIREVQRGKKIKEGRRGRKLMEGRRGKNLKEGRRGKKIKDGRRGMVETSST